MKNIVPHLWFDKEAREAALFYASLFENSRILSETILEDTPSGDAMAVHFELAGQPFEAISAGPYFRFNPSVSFMVACSSVEEVNAKWKALSDGGTEMMPLGEYPFSKWYGWIQDRYGLSWQLMLAEPGQTVQKITPNLLFSSSANGKAEEAARYYAGVFADSKIGHISRYGAGEASSPLAKVNYIGFKLHGADFSAMDNGYDVDYNFNEALSFIVYCENQREIDYYWDELSAVPEAEQCGWLKDKFGVSWQIVPTVMGDMMENGDREQIRRVTEVFLSMKKFDIDALKKAYDGG